MAGHDVAEHHRVVPLGVDDLFDRRLARGGAVAPAEDVGVITRAALQIVTADTACQRVIARTAEQSIGAVAAQQDVIAAAA